LEVSILLFFFPAPWIMFLSSGGAKQNLGKEGKQLGERKKGRKGAVGKGKGPGRLRPENETHFVLATLAKGARSREGGKIPSKGHPPAKGGRWENGASSTGKPERPHAPRGAGLAFPHFCQFFPRSGAFITKGARRLGEGIWPIGSLAHARG